MQIGEMAVKAGVSVQTVRFYEREGLLPAPRRTPSGYRIYEPTDLHDVQFIRQAQDLGFTLKEIRDLLPLHRTLASQTGPIGGAPELHNMADIARERLKGIDDKLRLLEAMKAELSTFLDRVERSGPPVCAAPRRP